jgi:hypothetical protein
MNWRSSASRDSGELLEKKPLATVWILNAVKGTRDHTWLYWEAEETLELGHAVHPYFICDNGIVNIISGFIIKKEMF